MGGVTPYLGLFARAGTRRAAVDAALAAASIHELPAARGCAYVIGAADYALALRLAARDTAELQTAIRHLDYTPAEQDALCAAVLDALTAGPADPAALKTALGDRVRSFGPAGKKRGLTTSLPLALGQLQVEGRIRRLPQRGRLDAQRFAYARWEPSPLAGDPGGDPLIAFAGRYWDWLGIASLDDFQWMSGLGKAAAKAATTPLGLEAVEPGSPLLLRPADRAALSALAPASAPQVHLLGSLDGLFLLRRDLSALLDPADQPRLAALQPPSAGGSLGDLPHHAIVDRGRIIGLWDYDPEAAQLVAWCFGGPSPAAAAAIEETAAFIREDLGDARAFSLDSPAARAPRLAALRAAISQDRS